MTTKVCGGCRIEKAIEEFNKNKASKDGLQWKCRECCSVYSSSRCWKRKVANEKIETRTSRVCPRCLLEKPLDEFHKNKRTRDGHSYQCKPCSKLIAKSCRSNSVGLGWKKARDTNKLYFINIRGGKCADCGLTPGDDWPLACFDFHHVEKKDHHVSILMNKSIRLHHDILLSEVNKCVVLCSNCHKKRHHRLSRG